MQSHTVWVLYGISISLVLAISLFFQLATYLPNYTAQRIKIPKQEETSFHGGCVEKSYLNLWRLSSVLTRLMKLMYLFLKLRCYTTELFCTEKMSLQIISARL